MSALTIVTISNGALDELFLTLKSIDSQIQAPFQNVVVASNIDDEKKSLIDKNYQKRYRKFIFNQDTSLYNAMNIGVRAANGTNVIFINSGDLLFSNESVTKVNRVLDLRGEKCNAFRIVQCFEDEIYVRPGVNNLKNWAHSGFVSPLPNEKHERIMFDESKPISADSYWMRACQKEYGLETHLDIITNFKLGGVSSNPSFKTIRIRKNYDSLRGFLSEMIKFVLIKLLGKVKYYIFISKLNKFDKLNCLDR